MRALELARGFLIEPAADSTVTKRQGKKPLVAKVSAAGMRFALFAPDRSAIAFSTAFSLALARAAGESVAVHALWGGTEQEGELGGGLLGSSIAAKRLARRLEQHAEVDVQVRGRVIEVALPAVEVQAAACLQRVHDLCEAPLLTTFIGARSDLLDPLISTHSGGVVLQKDADDPLMIELAKASLQGLLPGVTNCAMPRSPLTKTLMFSGRYSSPLRDLATEVVAGVGR